MQTATPTRIQLQEILAATDFSDTSAKALSYAKALARRFGSHLLLVHVSEPLPAVEPRAATWFDIEQTVSPLDEALDSEAASLRSEGMNAESINAEGSAGHEIVLLARAHKSELIVVGTHGHRGFDRLLFGSTAETVLRHADCPVLTVGPAAAEAPEGPWKPKELVCATSLDPKCAATAAYAYTLAASLGANFTFFHLEDPWQPDKEDAWKKFEAAFDKALPESENRKFPIESYFSRGSMAADIVTAAEHLKADLILMAARHVPLGSTRLFRGIVPQVLGSAPCPVLTLHPEEAR